MKLRMKLLSLVMITSAGFVLSFLFSIFSYFAIGRVRTETELIKQIQLNVEETRIAGAELYLDQDFRTSWVQLNDSFMSLIKNFEKLDDFVFLERLDKEFQEELTIIKSQRDLVSRQYETLSNYYHNLDMAIETSELARREYSLRFLNMKPPLISDRDWINIQLHIIRFNSDYSIFDKALRYTHVVIEERMGIIQNRFSEIRDIYLTLLILICAGFTAAAILISIRIADAISSDTKKIENGLYKMLTASELVSIDIQRDDELGLFAKTAEAIFKQLHYTRDELVEREKMASLGRLVAGVAHEVNTPIGIGVTVSSHLKSVSRKILQDYKAGNLSEEAFAEAMEDLYSSADILEKNMGRAAELIENFKLVAVDQTSLKQGWFNMDSLLHSCIISLQPVFKPKKVKIKMDCDPLLECNSYPGIFAQIITNLVQNAILHGFSDRKKGRIQITVSNESGKLSLEFKDNGKGMDEETISKIFDPFYSDSGGKGSGLGLHITYNLVSQALNGQIQCRSIINQETVFSMLMPMELRYMEPEEAEENIQP